MGIITFNGVSSDSLGIRVERRPDHEFPERDYEVVHVPGRNGDIYYDNGCYKNVEISYIISAPVDAGHTTAEKVQQILAWLHSGIGYLRLEDDYDPNVYRMAMYVEGNRFEDIYQGAVKAEIKFNCKPQKFLKSGETAVTVTNIITNQTSYEAKPLIELTLTKSAQATYYTSEIAIGNEVLQITKSPVPNIILDCETDNAYNETNNLNQYVSGTFPSIKPGVNNVSFVQVGQCKIIPRWWVL